MKPTNGSWFPVKARGGAKVSVPNGSSFISSSKLLVSISLLSSGTTGAMAERERGRDGGGGWENSVKDLSKNSVSCLSACVWERERESHSERLSVCSTQSRHCTERRSGMYDLPSWPVLTHYLLCSHTHSRSLTHPKHSLPLKRMCWARWENMCQTSNWDGLHSNSPQSNENRQRCWIFVL